MTNLYQDAWDHESCHTSPPSVDQKNTNTTYLWVEGFFVAQARRLATKLNRRYVAPFGSPIGHISMLGAEGVAGLWADAKQLAKTSKHVDPGADDSRRW